MCKRCSVEILKDRILKIWKFESCKNKTRLVKVQNLRLFLKFYEKTQYYQDSNSL